MMVVLSFLIMFAKAEFTPKLIIQRGHNSINTHAFSPDEKLMAIGAKDAQVVVYETRTGNEVFRRNIGKRSSGCKSISRYSIIKKTIFLNDTTLITDLEDAQHPMIENWDLLADKIIWQKTGNIAAFDIKSQIGIVHQKNRNWDKQDAALINLENGKEIYPLTNSSQMHKFWIDTKNQRIIGIEKIESQLKEEGFAFRIWDIQTGKQIDVQTYTSQKDIYRHSTN